MLENLKAMNYIQFLKITYGEQIQLLQNNQRIWFLLCVIHVFILVFFNVFRAILLRDKKSLTVNNAFENVLDESKFDRRKPNKILVDKGSKFSNILMKSWLQGNDIEIYNEGKSVVAEIYIRNSKSRIRKYMPRMTKNPYIQLDDIGDQYNSTYHGKSK